MSTSTRPRRGHIVATLGAVTALSAVLSLSGCLMEEETGEDLGTVEQDVVTAPGLAAPEIAHDGDQGEPDPEPWYPGDDQAGNDDDDDIFIVLPSAGPGTPGHEGGDGENNGGSND